MIDLNSLETYRENNRIEAKSALGGLPESIWETYSAFANTYGGIILLGVEENEDKSLRPVNLPDPDYLIEEFKSQVNSPEKASVNILGPDDIYTVDLAGKHIVVIDVPRAAAKDRPVYVCGDPLNTYIRNGEGDYRCTKDEIDGMVRDAAKQPSASDSGDKKVFTVTEDMLPQLAAGYAGYYNNCEGGCWTYEKAYKRIHQIFTMEDSMLLGISGGDGKTAGFLMGYFREYDDLTGFVLDEIVVFEGMHNMGYGTALMREMESRVRAAGGRHIALDGVNDGHHSYFYGKLGYYISKDFLGFGKFFDEETPEGD